MEYKDKGGRGGREGERQGEGEGGGKRTELRGRGGVGAAISEEGGGMWSKYIVYTYKILKKLKLKKCVGEMARYGS